MTHPGPLLTDYVDGALADDERARVEAHLDGCATCRDEVLLARAGRRAAGGLVRPPIPEGLSDAAIAEARRVAGDHHPEVAALSGRDRRRPNAPRLAGLIAAAAAVLIAVALLAPKLGQGSGTVAEQAAASSGGAAAASIPPASGVDIQHFEYTAETLTDAARSMRSAITTGETDTAYGNAAPAADAAAGFARDATWSLSRLDDSKACLDHAFVDPQGTLIRIILASYDGQRAYFGVYLVEPEGELPSTLRIGVASVDGCEILAVSSARL